jgi:hypothetical protein
MANIEETLVEVGPYRIWCDLQGNIYDAIKLIETVMMSPGFNKLDPIFNIDFVTAVEVKDQPITMEKLKIPAKISRLKYKDWP